MPVITFDTLEFSENLKKGGFTDEQAQSLAVENKRVFNEFAETQLATKADLLAVKEDLKADISVLKTDMSALKADIRLTHWGIGLLLLVVGIPALTALFM